MTTSKRLEIYDSDHMIRRAHRVFNTKHGDLSRTKFIRYVIADFFDRYKDDFPVEEHEVIDAISSIEDLNDHAFYQKVDARLNYMFANTMSRVISFVSKGVPPRRIIYSIRRDYEFIQEKGSVYYEANKDKWDALGKMTAKDIDLFRALLLDDVNRFPSSSTNGRIDRLIITMVTDPLWISKAQKLNYDQERFTHLEKEHFERIDYRKKKEDLENEKLKDMGQDHRREDDTGRDR